MIVQTMWRPPPPAYTVTVFGCSEYLRRRNFITAGHLVYTEIGPKRITIAQIQSCVVEYYGLRPIDMTTARRSREVARPRQVAMYLSKQLTPRSLPEIGRRFGGRDHTTVIHAVRQIEKLRAQDPELDSDIRLLTRQLEG